MAKGEDITTKYKVDISDLKKGITEANKQIKLSNAEFKAASAGMDDWSKSSEGISAKLKQLGSVLQSENKKLESYKKQLQEIEKAESENGKRADELKTKLSQLAANGVSKTSAEYKKYEKALNDVEKEQLANQSAADKLKVSILNQQSTVNKTEKEMKGYENTLKEVSKAEKMSAKNGKSVEDNLKQIAKEADEAKESLNNLGSKLAGGLKKGLAALGTAAAGLVTGLVASSEASQEFVEDMGKLETAFTTSGHSVETGKKAYQDFVGILGETDQAVEAVNHLAKLTKNEKELAEWTNIAAGVYATFGDSLPLEGLTEAANETAKVGQVTGPLADALNWAGLSEDAFNESLAKCNTEQERASLITQTLSGLYEEAGNTYQETNADLIAARQATSDLAAANAEMGRIITPIVTKIKETFAEFLADVTPKIKEFVDSVDWDAFGETVKNALSKLTDALIWVIDNKDTVIAGITGIIAAFAAAKIIAFVTALTQVISGIKAAAAAQGIFNAVMSANPIGLIVTAIGLLVAAIVLLIQNWDTVKEVASKCWEAIKEGASAAWEAISGFFSGIGEWFSEKFTAAKEGVINAWNTVTEFFSGIWEAISGFFADVGTWFSDKFTEAKNAITSVFSTVAQWFSDNVVEPIKTFFQPLVDFFTTLFNVMKELAQGCWNAIVIIWSIVSEWFNTNVIQPVQQFFTELWEGIKNAAQTAWDFIVSVWTAVSTWFNENVITPVKDFFTTLWNGIKTAASTAWNAIKGVWNAVSGWFNNTIIKPVSNFFSGMWNGLKNGASKAWEGIKSVFSKVTSWFKDQFTKAWTAVKNVFSVGGKIFDGIKEGITSAFKTVVNAIIKGINKVIAVPFNAINNMLDKIRNVSIAGVKPFSGLISRFNVPQIPTLQTGIAKAKKGHQYLLEGKNDEMVIPLHKNAPWLKALAGSLLNEMKTNGVSGDALGVGANNMNSNVNNFTQIINAPKQPSRIELYRQTKNLLALKGGV